jgi:ligand-binding sensor domain-containing protein/anti-sigma regulatory factor (Ser/Thr protein kinase)
MGNAVFVRSLKRLLIALAVLVPGALWCSPVRSTALDTVDSIKSDYHHTSWGTREGAPSFVWSIAETPDGWLWLASPQGLTRFDGLFFEKVEIRTPDSAKPPSVRIVYVDKSGELWVILANGDLFLRSGDRNNSKFIAIGSPPDHVSDLAEDGQGRIWAQTSTGKITVRDHGKWLPVGPAWGVPDGNGSDLMLDAADQLWYATDAGMFVLRKDAAKFEKAAGPAYPNTPIERSQAGKLWLAGPSGALDFIDRQTYTANQSEPLGPLPESDVQLLNRTGAIWSVDCAGGGICRVGNPEWRLGIPRNSFGHDTYQRADGLTSDTAMTIFEDHAGAIWVGTRSGIDRFTKNVVNVVHFPESLTTFSMLPEEGGKIWVGTAVDYPGKTDHLWLLDKHPTIYPGTSGAILSFYRDVDGSIILGGALGSGLRSLRDGHVTTFSLPADLQKDNVAHLARDAAGDLWVNFDVHGVYKFHDGLWIARGGFASLPRSHADAMAMDRQGAIWLAYESALYIIHGNTLVRYGEEKGLTVGSVTGIFPGKPTVVAGARGLSAFDGTSFVPLRFKRPEVATHTSGLVRTEDGALWLNASVGAVRIAPDDLKRGLSAPDFAMPAQVFGTDAGMPGNGPPGLPANTLVKGSDGDLWFSATDGLAWLDPSKIGDPPTPPKVVIRSLMAGGVNYLLQQKITLPALTKSLVVRYTAMSQTMPELLEFSVFLHGLDKAWQNQGSVREINYSNLSPGPYTLQVRACNADGVCNDDGATLDFVIAAAWYQTHLFFSFCLLLAASILYGLYRLYHHRVVARIEARSNERLKERERIARELHDTLVQDVEALILCIGILNRDHGDSDFMTANLTMIENAARVALDSTRTRVGGLRQSGSVGNGLLESLKDYVEKLTALYTTGIELLAPKGSVELHEEIAEEVGAVVREALLNAARHAKATLVSVKFTYDARLLEICVSDNGIGLEPSILLSGQRQNHWGLVGMRERARKIGGTLKIARGADGGTIVRLRVPASIAYVRPSRWFPNAFRRRPQVR